MSDKGNDRPALGVAPEMEGVVGDANGAALELAKILFCKMERLCPSGDTWETIDTDEREIYLYCIDEVLRHTDLVGRAIGDCDRTSHDNNVDGHT